jgi:hypothetical protein
MPDAQMAEFLEIALSARIEHGPSNEGDRYATVGLIHPALVGKRRNPERRAVLGARDGKRTATVGARRRAPQIQS